ncbi:Monocarboxylate transporter 2 [Triplophysa tibetana]|uniref:Monocarboxylate transporter 2 n=1 Tax=Triplophysa tibetana TaxID=1572043 RepID=A0A5A9NEK9_9TELE|nr:Monocarboxylate transporter 2 [Triplophysa tibetana]
MPSDVTDLDYTPPDGGWGWVVVFASFISIGFAYSFPKSLTIYFKEIQEHFIISYSEIAWVSSIMMATTYAGGPVSSVLVNRYGSRPVVIIGGLMVGVAMMTASFATSILHLFICVGVIGGFGLAFNLQPSLTITSKYFLVKRPIANGLAMTGSPVLLSVLAPLNQFLFDNFGWRGSFLILGGVLLHCCVAGCLMRPIKVKLAVKKLTHQTATEVDVTHQTAETVNIQGCVEKVNRFIDLSIFKERGFLIYLVGNVVMLLGIHAPIVFLVPYAEQHGIDEEDAALLLSIFALADTVACPVTGFLASTGWIRPNIQYFFSFAVACNGVCHLTGSLLTGYVGLVVYTVIFGSTWGMVGALKFEVLMDLVGAHQFSSTVGLVTVIECVPVLLGPPIFGLLVDIFKDYKFIHFTSGGMLLTSGVFLFIMNYYNYRQLENEEKASKKEIQISSANQLPAREEANDKEAPVNMRSEEATYST